MTNNDLLEMTKEIVVAMINSKLINTSVKRDVNKDINIAIESIYSKLSELNNKDLFDDQIA